MLLTHLDNSFRLQASWTYRILGKCFQYQSWPLIMLCDLESTLRGQKKGGASKGGRSYQDILRLEPIIHVYFHIRGCVVESEWRI